MVISIMAVAVVVAAMSSIGALIIRIGFWGLIIL